MLQQLARFEMPFSCMGDFGLCRCTKKLLSVIFPLFFQTLNIPDAYQDERFDPAVCIQYFMLNDISWQPYVT